MYLNMSFILTGMLYRLGWTCKKLHMKQSMIKLNDISILLILYNLEEYGFINMKFQNN